AGAGRLAVGDELAAEALRIAAAGLLCGHLRSGGSGRKTRHSERDEQGRASGGQTRNVRDEFHRWTSFSWLKSSTRSPSRGEDGSPGQARLIPMHKRRINIG